MRIHADGYIDLRRTIKVHMPGCAAEVTPSPEDEAVAFLLSHAFPGHRKVVRPLTEGHRRRIRLARWADSVSERMALVDRVWRDITQPVLPPARDDEPQLIQVVRYGEREYPLYLDGGVTRVIPPGGVPAGSYRRIEQVDLKTA
ncbi:MAG: hypothetical protein RQ751_07975 [Longimicrobiales bacterium]|nr:hypothetical protein [Longimicrobiales bacterium]